MLRARLPRSDPHNGLQHSQMAGRGALALSAHDVMHGPRLFQHIHNAICTLQGGKSVRCTNLRTEAETEDDLTHADGMLERLLEADLVHADLKDCISYLPLPAVCPTASQQFEDRGSDPATLLLAALPVRQAAALGAHMEIYLSWDLIEVRLSSWQTVCRRKKKILSTLTSFRVSPAWALLLPTTESRNCHVECWAAGFQLQKTEKAPCHAMPCHAVDRTEQRARGLHGAGMFNTPHNGE